MQIDFVARCIYQNFMQITNDFPYRKQISKLWLKH